MGEPWESCLLIFHSCGLFQIWPIEWGRSDAGSVIRSLMAPTSVFQDVCYWARLSENPAVRSSSHKEKLCVHTAFHSPSSASADSLGFINHQPWDELVWTPSPKLGLQVTPVPTAIWWEWQETTTGKNHRAPSTYRTARDTYQLFQTMHLD